MPVNRFKLSTKEFDAENIGGTQPTGQVELAKTLPDDECHNRLEKLSSDSFKVLGSSVIDRDERECIKEWGLPFHNSNISLSGTQTTIPDINFMPKDDTLFHSLCSYKNISTSSTESIAGRKSEDFSRKYSFPSLSEISEVLKTMPKTASPTALMEQLLNHQIQLKKECENRKEYTIQGNIQLNGVAGIPMSAKIQVREDATYELLDPTMKDFDVHLSRLSPTILEVFVRARFIGQDLLKIKEEVPKRSGVFLHVLTVCSVNNKLVLKPDKLTFELSGKAKLPIKRTFTVANNNSCELGIKAVFNGCENFSFDTNCKELHKRIPPESSVNIDVIWNSLSSDFYKKASSLDIYIDCPPLLSRDLVKAASLSIITDMNFNPESIGCKDLLLECTSACIVWGCVKLRENAKTKCFLRNKSNSIEYLKLTIEGSHHSDAFRLVENNELTTSLSIVMGAQEKREIWVNFSPTYQTYARGSVLIRRSTGDIQKKCIPLYGFGGRGGLLADKLAFDIEKNAKKLLICQQDLSTSFTLANGGDGVIFYNIEPSVVEGSFVRITPKCGLISPDQKLNICIELKPTAKALDEILLADINSEVKLSTIIVMHGDEPTRLRIKRLQRKYHSTEPEMFAQLSNKIKSILQINCSGEMHESHLKFKDPPCSLHSLCKDGIKEWSIDLVASRYIIEAAAKECSREYLALDTTVSTDETTFISDSFVLR